MRRHTLALSIVAGLVLAALAAPVAGAATRERAHPARMRARQVWADRHAQAVWRGLHPKPAKALPGSPTSAAPTSWTTVKATKQISQDSSTPRDGSEPDTQVEPYIAMDPNNANHIVAVMQQGRFPDGGSVGPGYATSQDGGRTWVTDEFPGVTTDRGGFWDRASDPWVGFGPDGAVYAVLIAFQEIACDSGIVVLRSDDGGITWAGPYEVQHDTSCSYFNDKESIGVDSYLGSPFYGRVYVTWDRVGPSGQPVEIKYSDDRGQTWSALMGVSGSVSGIGANVLSQPNGDVTVVYIEVLTNWEVSQISGDGGVTWAASVHIGQDEETSPPDQRVNCGLPAFAVDPVTSYLYVGWCDTRLRSDGLNDMLVWTSTTDGTTWTGPVKANPDSSGSGLGHLDLGLAANDHVVHAFYQIRRNDGGVWTDFVIQRYTHSDNDGVTYTNEIGIGPRTNLNFAAQAGGLFLGDYLGITASGTRAHPVWCRASDPGYPTTYHETTWSSTIGK